MFDDFSHKDIFSDFSYKKIPKLGFYIFSDSMTQEFYEKYKDLIVYMIDKYQYEGRDKVAIAIGCTGGKHRSVSIARKIHEDISKLGYKVYLEHRDIDKGR